MPHAPLDVVHEPALAVHRDDRDALAGDHSAVLEDRVARHDVLADLADLHLLLPGQSVALGLQGGLQMRVLVDLRLRLTTSSPVRPRNTWRVSVFSSTL